MGSGGCCDTFLGAIEGVALKFYLHVIFMETQLDHDSAGGVQFVIDFAWFFLTFDSEGDSNILDIFLEKGMDLIDVGIRHGF